MSLFERGRRNLHTSEKKHSFIKEFRHVAIPSTFFLLTLSLGSCAKKSLSSKESAGNEPSPTSSTTSTEKVPQAKGEAIDLPEAMATPRTHFQTRSDLKFFIDTFDLQSGQRIEMGNLSLNQNVFARELPVGFFVPENPQSPKYFIEDRAFSLVAIPASEQQLGYRLMIRLVPGVLLSDRKMGYGSNQFSLFLEGAALDRKSAETVFIRDFSYFTLGTSAFVNSQAQRGSRYQGRASWVAGSLVRGPKSDLTVGTTGILNR